MATGGASIRGIRQAVKQAMPDPNLVLVQATPAFPRICLNCEKPASVTLKLGKSFLVDSEHDSDSVADTFPIVESFEVFICPSCLAQRSGELTQPSPWLPIRRLMSHANGFAGLVVIAISSLFFKEAFFPFKLAPLIMGLLPLSIGIWLIRPVWQNSLHLILPKPTLIDRAIEFTPALNLDHEPYWRAYQFRSTSYADSFRQANIHHLWDTKSPDAQRAAKLRKAESNRSNWIVGIIVGLVLAWSLWSELISPFLNGE